MNFLEHLAQEVERTGHTVQRRDSSFLVVSINLEIEGEEVEPFAGQHPSIKQVHVTAIHKQLFPGGIWDCLVGFGEDKDTAFSDAARTWMAGIFQPIHELLVPSNIPRFQVIKIDSVKLDPETREMFAEKIYLGALQFAGDFVKRRDILDEEVILKKMPNALANASTYYWRKLHWVKAFISKMPNGTINGSCWLNNQDWAEGLQVLYQFAEEWGGVESYTMMKQLIIIKPCE